MRRFGSPNSNAIRRESQIAMRPLVDLVQLLHSDDVLVEMRPKLLS